jgi:hypothetical protein
MVDIPFLFASIDVGGGERLGGAQVRGRRKEERDRRGKRKREKGKEKTKDLSCPRFPGEV